MPRHPSDSAAPGNLELVTGSKPAPFPRFIKPCLAETAKTPPTSDKWVHEVKLDGYRLQAHINRGAVKLYTRQGLNWTSKFLQIGATLKELLPHEVVLDGEAAVLRADGTSDFEALQQEIRNPWSERIIYVVFDVLYLDGFDLRVVPFIERRRLLTGLFRGFTSDRIQLNPYLEGDGEALFKQVCAQQLEGIISKRKDSAYRSGRQDYWIKSKCRETETFPVVAFTEKLGAKPRRIASLHVGRWERGRLVYGGKVGTGFSDEMAHTLREMLDLLIRPTSPLSVKVRKPEATWVDPILQIEVQYGSVTSAGVLRAASFKGVREDLTLHELESGRPPTRPSRSKR